MQQGRGDEGNIHDEKRKLRTGTGCGTGEGAGREEARIGAFHQANAGIVAQLHGDLAESGVDGGHVGRAALQQAIGESSRRRAHIEARAPAHIDVPMIEGAGQLDAAPADERQVLSQQPDGGIRAHRYARLVDLLLIDEDAASKDERTRPLAAGCEPALHEENIDACFAGGGHL